MMTYKEIRALILKSDIEPHKYFTLTRDDGTRLFRDGVSWITMSELAMIQIAWGRLKPKDDWTGPETERDYARRTG